MPVERKVEFGTDSYAYVVGRSGEVKLSGVVVRNYRNSLGLVVIDPVNHKGKEVNGSLAVPVDAIPRLIEALQFAMNGHTQDEIDQAEALFRGQPIELVSPYTR